MRKYSESVMLYGVVILLCVSAKADSGSQTAVTEGKPIPEYFEVRQNYPNPFNSSTVIEYDLPEEAGVYVAIYDILGHRIETLMNEVHAAGRFRVEWDGKTKSGSGAATGTYFYVLVAEENYSIGKMLLLK